MKKTDNYILVTWWWDDMGDHKPTFETSFRFVTDKELGDIKGLMKAEGIKQWIKNPETVTSKTYKQGTGSLIEFRNVEVVPMKIVESWSYKPEIVNE